LILFVLKLLVADVGLGLVHLDLNIKEVDLTEQHLAVELFQRLLQLSRQLHLHKVFHSLLVSGQLTLTHLLQVYADGFYWLIIPTPKLLLRMLLFVVTLYLANVWLLLCPEFSARLFGSWERMVDGLEILFK